MKLLNVTPDAIIDIWFIHVRSVRQLKILTNTYLKTFYYANDDSSGAKNTIIL